MIIYRTDNVKSPGLEELGRARNELSYPRSIKRRSASKPVIFG
jgi:hypothetical protein